MLARRGSTYHFRRSVPHRLRMVIGRSEWWASLGTSRATAARARAALLYARVERIFDVADEIIKLQAEIIENQAAIADIERNNAEARAKLAEMRSLMAEAEAWTAITTRLEQIPVAGLSEAAGRARDASHRQSGRLAEAREQQQQTEAMIERIATAARAAPPLPQATPPTPAAPLASKLVEPHLERRARIDNTLTQVIGQERKTIRLFIEACGDRPVSNYTRADTTLFIDRLRQMPASYGRTPADAELTIEQLIARAERQNAARLTDKTVKRHLSALSSFLRYAVDHGHLGASAHTDLISGHRFRTATGAREQRDAWTSEDLQALFTSPIWTGCQGPMRRADPGPHIIRDGRFWLPLLALFHGARVEELADLRRRDVVNDGHIWALKIREWVEQDRGDDGTVTEQRRRLKTKNARRTIPLHPELARLGFLRHIETTALTPDDPLFPDLERQGADGKRGPRLTRWFVHYRRTIGIYRHGVGMHGFRHTAITRLTDQIMTEQQRRHRDYLMGHAASGSEGSTRYDKGPGLAAMAETLALLRYPELDLSHLYIAP